MKSKYIFLLSLFGILFVSCVEEKSLKEYMVGSWQTTYLKIEMPTYEKSDSLYVFEDTFENNPELVAQSTYKNDGTFSAWFVTKEGKRISESEGKWSAKNDSLQVEFFYDGREMKVRYHITETTEGFVGQSKFDWDNDGSFDDDLLMKSKRLKIE